MAVVIALVFASLLILPILFSLKCDNTLGRSAPWVAIWTPMWVVDGALLIMAVLLFLDNEDTTNEEGEVIREKIPLVAKFGNFLSSTSFILIQIFVTMHLDHFIHWSWFATFSPWFIYEFLNAMSVVQTAFASVPRPNPELSKLNVEEGEGGEDEVLLKKVAMENEYFEKAAARLNEQKHLLIYVLRIWLAIFLALKLDQIVAWNWGLVLLPMWVYLFVQYTFAYFFRRWGIAVLRSIQVENIEQLTEIDPLTATKIQHGQSLMSAGFMGCVMQAIPLFMSLLLVSRLTSAHITTFVIILPVFIILGCCCCFVFCGIFCLANVDTEDLARSMQMQGSGGDGTASAGEGANGNKEGTYVPPDPSQVGAGAAAGQSGQAQASGADAATEGISPTFIPAYGTFDTSLSSSANAGAGTAAPAGIVMTPFPNADDENRNNSASHVPNDSAFADDELSPPATTATTGQLLPPSTIDADID
jgi:hypothetical protein